MADTVRIGLIGCGGMANAHLRWLRDIPEAQVVAITDPSPASLEKTWEKNPGLQEQVRLHDDFRSLLGDPEVDAVQVHSPHTCHFEQAMAALAAGKHVLLEKPMVTNTDHAHTLIDAWQHSGKVLMISYQRHFMARFRYAREVIRGGRLGEIQYVAAYQAQEWLRLTRGTWRQTQELSGGGQINDSGSHLIDIIMWVTGLRAAEVTARQEFFDVPVDINTAATVRFTNGALGTLSIVGNAPRWWEDITFVGSEGALYIRQDQPLVHLDATGKPVDTNEIGEDGTPDRNWVDAILGRGEVEVPPQCGLAVIELTEAAWESAKNGGVPTPVKSRA